MSQWINATNLVENNFLYGCAQVEEFDEQVEGDLEE